MRRGIAGRCSRSLRPARVVSAASRERCRSLAAVSAFLQASLPVNPMKCEYYLPTVVTNALETGKADVHVLTSADKWHGITYREDKPELVEALKKMSEDGLYPVDRLF